MRKTASTAPCRRASPTPSATATATRVQVRCHIEDGVLEVSVRDNGIGCKSVTPGFGLQHMQERMLMLGGTFWYENSDGFCIRAEIPLRKTPGSEKRKQEETV